MMNYKKLRIGISILTILLVSIGSFAQKMEFVKGMSVSVGPGMLSYYGDLSHENFNPFKTITESSKVGFALSIQKQFDPVFGVAFQYTYGSTYSAKETENMYFSGSLVEYSLLGKLTPLGFFPDLRNKYNLQPYLTAGLGSLGYRSSKKYIDTDQIIPPRYGFDSNGETKTSREHGLVLPFGLGLSIPINENFAINVDHTYRYTNTDVLDAHIGETDNKTDMYSFTSVGFRFTLEPELQTFTRRSRPDRKKPRIKDIVARDKQMEIKDVANDPTSRIYVESLIDDVVTAGDVFAVNLRINKGDYNGPAKLFQRFPDKFTALEASSTNGRFSFSNRNALIEWDNMPTDSIITYTYYVRIDKDVIGSQTVTGRFEYENEDNWETVRFNNYIFADKSAADIIDDNAEKVTDLYKEEAKKDINQEKEKEIEKEAEIEKKIKEEEEGKLKTEEKKKVETKTKTNINVDPLILKDPVDEIEFRIQCGAFKDSNQGGKALVERYGITENVREVYENGWYKYTVGSFKTYVEAVNFKNTFVKRTKLPGTFIVAYKNGKRIPNISDAFKK